MPISYTQKVNERVIGQSIINESHVVGIIGVATPNAGFIRLIEVPQAPSPFSTVSVTGSGGPYNEITSGTPTGGQFLVDYITGGIQFSVSQDGNVVLVSYIGLGSEPAAEDVNEIQTPVGIALNYDGSLSNHIVKPISISNIATDDFTFPRNVTVSGLTTVGVVHNNVSGVLSTSLIFNADVSASAAIAYSKLNLSGSILATDIASGQVVKSLNTMKDTISLSGTSNQVIVTNGVGTITLSTPQNIAITSSPTFAGETITGNSIILGSTAGPGASIGIYIGSLGGSNLVYDTSISPHQWEFLDGSSNRYLVISESANTLGINLTSGSPQATLDINGTAWLHSTNALYFGNINTLFAAIRAPNTISSSYTLILPTAQGAASTFLQNDGAGNLIWTIPSGTPAGSNTQVQYNNSGVFAGAAVLTTNGAQVGIGNPTPDPSAILDIASTTQGFLPPRMTSTQRTAIPSPATSLIVYDTTVNQLMMWNASSWVILG